MNSTKLFEFKLQLQEFTPFTKEQMGCSMVEDVARNIEKLLNDDLMMKPNNPLSFAERTQLVKISLLNNALQILSADDYHGVHDKIRILSNLIFHTDIGHAGQDTIR
jgi:hypothetical protein